MSQSTTNADRKAHAGKRAQIAAVKFYPDHAEYIGQAGTITKYIASRGLYVLKLDSGKTWEALPENLSIHL